MYRALDRKPTRVESRRQRAAFTASRRAEADYGRRLRAIARHVGEIVGAFDPHDAVRVSRMNDALRRYSDLVKPWAEATARRMLADVSRRDEAAWAKVSRQMSWAIAEEIRRAPTGELLRESLERQVELITSLPVEAGRRVHELALDAMTDSGRADEVAREILRTSDVTVSRANLIARTEVARCSSGLVEARATHIGSEGYIWRTARDRDVRHSHAQMEGKFVKWGDPPTLSDGTTTHAGGIYNCRCYPEPVLPDARLIARRAA